MSSNNDFIDLTNLEEIRTGTHIIIDYISCTFPLIVYDGQREDDIILDTIKLILNEMGYTDDDLVQDEYALNRFKYQYTIASSIAIRLVGPVQKNGYHSCQVDTIMEVNEKEIYRDLIHSATTNEVFRLFWY